MNRNESIAYRNLVIMVQHSIATDHLLQGNDPDVEKFIITPPEHAIHRIIGFTVSFVQFVRCHENILVYHRLLSVA